MSFLDLLKLLNRFGPALKDNWADILAVIEAVKRIFGRVAPVPAGEVGTLSAYQMTEAEAIELDALAANLGGSNQVDIASLLEFAALLTTTGGKALGLLLMKLFERILEGK